MVKGPCAMPTMMAHGIMSLERVLPTRLAPFESNMQSFRDTGFYRIMAELARNLTLLKKLPL